MIEEISSLLFQTFSATGDDATMQIQNAAERLNQYGGSAEFCQCFFQIIQSNDENQIIKQSIKNSAIIFLKNMIELHWEELSPESKMVIINSLPPTLLTLKGTTYLNLRELTGTVVKKTFFSGEWGNILDIIFSGFEGTTKNHFLMSLILLHSVSSLFQKVSDDKLQLYEDITNRSFTVLTNFVSKPQLLHSSLCFEIAINFSKDQIPPFLISNPDALQVWIDCAMRISAPNQNPYYSAFTISAINFLQAFMFKHIELFKINKPPILSPEVLMSMLNSVVQCINLWSDSNILCHCAYFIKLAISYEPVWLDILADFAEFTKFVLLPFFIPSGDDINDAVNDPFTFIQNFHSNSLDDSDSRSILTKCLETASKVYSEQILSVFGPLFMSFIPVRSEANDHITFGVSYLFSIVSIYISGDQSIYGILASLLQEHSVLARCSSLLILGNMRGAPTQIILMIFALLLSDEELIVVKYYASIALSSLLPNLDNETSESVRSQMGDGKAAIDAVKSFFFLAQEFHDYNFIELIGTFIQFFGPALIHIYEEFVSELFQTFLHFSKSDSQSNAILKSLDHYLDLLAHVTDQVILEKTISFLFGAISNAIRQNILVPNAIVSVSELIVNMIAISPTINEGHWQILGLLHQVVLSSSQNLSFEINVNSFNESIHSYLIEVICIAYKNLIIRNPQALNNPEITNNLISMSCSMIGCKANLKEAAPVFSFIAALLILLVLNGNQTIDLSQIFERFTPIVVDCLVVNDIRSYAAILFGALLISNSEFLLSFIQQNRFAVMSNFVNSIEYNNSSVLLTVLNKKFNVLNRDELVMLLCHALKVLNEHSIVNSLFNESPECYIDMRELSLFNEKDVLNEFRNLLNSLNVSNNDIIQEVQSNFEVPIDQIVFQIISQIC